MPADVIQTLKRNFLIRNILRFTTQFDDGNDGLLGGLNQSRILKLCRGANRPVNRFSRRKWTDLILPHPVVGWRGSPEPAEVARLKVAALASCPTNGSSAFPG
jgi:hypothetical protein